MGTEKYTKEHGADDGFKPPFWARHPWITLVGIGGGLLGLGSYYQVDETQDAVVKRITGDVTQVIGREDRGLFGTGIFLKLPFLDSVTYIDHRPMLYTIEPDYATTKDTKQLGFDYFAIIQVKDPYNFYTSSNADFDTVRRQLEDTAYPKAKDSIGTMGFIDAATTSRGKIIPNVMDVIKAKAPEYGIDVLDMDIMRIELREDMVESVMKNMILKRGEQSREYLADGQKQKTIIMATADKNAAEQEIAGFTYKQGRIGQADAKVAELYNDVFTKNREIVNLIYETEKVRKSLGPGGTNATLIIKPDSEFLKSLNIE